MKMKIKGNRKIDTELGSRGVPNPPRLGFTPTVIVNVNVNEQSEIKTLRL